MKNNSHNMTTAQKIKCHAIIHSASACAGVIGAGKGTFPYADRLLITPLQGWMALQLGNVFGIRIRESSQTATRVLGFSKSAGIATSSVLWGLVPTAGPAINAGTAVIITEEMGWLLTESFARQMTQNAKR